MLDKVIEVAVVQCTVSFSGAGSARGTACPARHNGLDGARQVSLGELQRPGPIWCVNSKMTRR